MAEQSGRPSAVADDDTHWLTAAEQQAWSTLASVLIRLDAVLDARLRRDAGISHFDYGVLAALSAAPRRTMRMSDLAARAEGSLPRLSQVVTRLESKGWVQRTPDPANGRYTLAVLTDKGYAKIAAAAPDHVRAVRTLVFDPLTKAQVKQLAAIGQRIAGAIDSAPADM
jgi:DNA-binding MarR family transcriptional regulator